MGQAIFSNIDAIIYGKTDQSYDRIVKRFGGELKKQKIIPTVRAGYVTAFVKAGIITEEELNKIFRFHSWKITDYLYAEMTIFNWE